MEEICLKWYDANVVKPKVDKLDCVDVLVYCNGAIYKASYIKHKKQKVGKFYIDMNWPKKIFENITEYVTMWSYIDSPDNIDSKYSEFKIKEYNGKFTILKRFKETTGFLWWKKDTDVWDTIDIYGNRRYYIRTPRGRYITNESILTPEYKKLDDAKDAIKMIVNGDIYHSI